MRMGRYLGFEERHRVRASGFSEIVQGKSGPLAWMHRRVALHVRESKIGLAVSSICGPQQREQRRVLAEGQDLAITKGPALRRKVEWKDSDFRDKWIHG